MKVYLRLSDTYEPMSLFLLQQVAAELSAEKVEIGLDVYPTTPRPRLEDGNPQDALLTISGSGVLVPECKTVLSVGVPGFDGLVTLHGGPVEAMTACLHHLISLGHRSIAFVCGPEDVAGNAYRRTSFEQAVSGLPTDPDGRTGTGPRSVPAIQTAAFDTDYVPESVANLVRSLFHRGYTAFVCSSDYLSNSLIHEAMKEGLSVPGNLSVIGYGDIPESAMLEPPLTTVRLPYARVSKALVQILKEIAVTGSTDIDSLAFRSELIVRQSTGPAPQSPALAVADQASNPAQRARRGRRREGSRG